MARTPRGEIDKLKAENKKLKAENKRLAKQASSKKASKGRLSGRALRSTGVTLLLALAVALLTAGNLLFWVGNTAVKTDRYIDAVGPVIKNAHVQDTLALYTTNQIYNNFDVEDFLVQVLPPRADFLAPQLSSQLKSRTNDALKKVLSKPKFQDKWVEVQTRQHQRLIGFISNYEGNGVISLNDVYQRLSQSLKDTKLAFLADKQLPDKVGAITIANASWLPVAHDVVVHIDLWRILALVLLIIFLATAVWLSRNRRRTIYIFSIAVAIMMFLTLVSLRLLRETIADKVDPQYSEGVRSAIQITLHPLALQTTTLGLVAVLIGFIAWVSGGSRGARGFKSWIDDLFSGRLHGKLFGQNAGPAVLWIQNHKRQLQWAAIIIVGAIMLLVHLTLKALLLYILLMIVLVLLIEVIGGQSSPKTARR